MPRRPLALQPSGRIRPRSPWQSDGIETPLKKRQRRSNGSALAVSVSPSQQHVLHHQISGLGTLTEALMAESLALLPVCDIGQCSAVCNSWCSAVNCQALWALAAPHLGLLGRIVQRQEISRRRSRGVVLQGLLLGERREKVAVRIVDLKNANAGVDDDSFQQLFVNLAFCTQ